MVKPNVSPNDPVDEQPTIGLIGMGAMGSMYARRFSQAGWKKIHVCDRPAKLEILQRDFADVPNVKIMQDGHAVSRSSDFILYSVEAEFIDKVVAQYGPSTKLGAIVAGQTSVKAPEKLAFETYLPEDAQIVSIHSLHGPTVSPHGQPLVIIKHRASDDALVLVESILRSFRSRHVYLSYEDHDLVTANTQAVTHAAFLSMGTAWASSLSYPWEQGYYVGGIETVKVNIMLRIYSNKWHVYAGLAILNPSAREQIDQYAASATDLFKLMLDGDREALRKRVYSARDVVFGPCSEEDLNGNVSNPRNRRRRAPILLSESILDQFSLGNRPPSAPPSPVVPRPSIGFAETNNNLRGSPRVLGNITTPSPRIPASPRLPAISSTGGTAPANSHLALLAMVDCWAQLDIQPFHHLSLAATPIFRMWIGVAENLFRSPRRLDFAIEAALTETSHRSDDLEFVVAARGWSQCVHFGNFELYRRRFMETAEFFESRFEEAAEVGGRMIQAIMESSEEFDEERSSNVDDKVG